MKNIRRIFSATLAVLLLAVLGAGAAFPAGVSAASANAAALRATNLYVALGDSVASGAGLPVNTSDPQASPCERSIQAYAFQVAKARQVPLSHFACGGATIEEGLLGPQTTHGTTVAAQLDRAFSGGIPKTISITIGTNDIHWSTYLGKCYQSECGSFTDSAAVAWSIWQVHQHLRQVLNQIAARSGTIKPQVIITGYFQPLSNSQPACADTQGLSSDEINWIRQQAKLLNGTLNLMAYEYDFVHFAPVDYTGHELCSADPWVQGFRDAAPFHPTADGQAAIARSVLSVMR